MWLRTVTSATPSLVAITFAVAPSAISSSTSCCRAVRCDSGAGSDAASGAGRKR